MASTTTRLTFSFHHHQLQMLQSSRANKTNLHLPFHNPRASSCSYLALIKDIPSNKLSTISSSIDVSKTTDGSPSGQEAEFLVDNGGTAEEKVQEEEEEREQKRLDPRRVEERFAVLNTGIYECRSCGYRYDEAVGDPSYPIPPGFEFGKLPEDWRCPTCGAAKSFFQSKSVEIAGFAENQQYGLGGNTLTSGQKAFLIYGSLLLAFVLFLSGYFLQ